MAEFFIFRLLKAFTLGVYKGTYILFCLIVRHPKSGVYNLLSLSNVNLFVRKKFAVDNGETIVINSPDFVGFCSEYAKKKSPTIQINTPAMGMFDIYEVMVVGGIDFMFVNHKAIHHDMFIPSQHYCPAENYAVISINRNKGFLKLRLTQECRRIPTGVFMLGQCSGSYAHWLTETLAKLSILDAMPELSDLPLIVDADLHQNHYTSIDLINKNRREIIKVRRSEPIIVDKLIAISCPGYERYVPEGVFCQEPPMHINTFSRTALMLLRKTAWEALDGEPISLTKKIFLRRSEKANNIRGIANIDEVEDVMRARGIHLMDSEYMCFYDQVAIFKTAEIIVAPIGGAAANMIFAPLGCRIIILSPYYDEANFFFYTNLAGVLGHHLQYILGRQVNQRNNPHYRNYSINTELLLQSLDFDQLTNSS